MNELEILQITYDFKLFIRESLNYNYTYNDLKKFAKYMDCILYNKEIKYYNVLKSIKKNNYSLILSNNLKQYINNNIINDNHLPLIKKYIKLNIKRIDDDYRNKFNIALSDFEISYKNEELININDIYNFAKYMQGFYPKIPYLDVANSLSITINDDQSINENYYNNFFNSECLNCRKTRCGHFMEIINFSRERYITKKNDEKVLTKKP